jgi:hypothetical protein
VGQSHFAGLAVGRPGSARLLLHGNGRPWTKSEHQRPLVAACRAAQIDPPVSFHDLRHTYASRAVMNGMALPVVAAQLGTPARAVERHYAHLAPSFVALAVRQTFGELGIVEPANVVPLGRLFPSTLVGVPDLNNRQFPITTRTDRLRGLARC